jgi:tRNA dimethylallyltransferase
MSDSTLLAIVGPTGSGKTQLCVQLALRRHCAVVNADSRQIYRELPIGTAAPTAAEQQGVKHYFVGTHSLGETYSAGQYERDAVALLEQLMQIGKTQPFAILSGGSMMYVDAVCYGLDDIPSVPEQVRQTVRQKYIDNGLQWLQSQVQLADPDYFLSMADRCNPQRLMHALEITLHTGKPYSTFRCSRRANRPWKLVKVGLSLPRELLYQRIEMRVDQMINDGLVDEAKQAFDNVEQQYADIPNSLRTVGYNEMYRYLKGEWTLNKAVDMIKQNTRHYAKRQMTWLRRQQDIHWLDRTLSDNILIQQIEQLL